ncbi:MAG: hypothetical protein WKF83_07780 [Nocardioidaceae bacterium]
MVWLLVIVGLGAFAPGSNPSSLVRDGRPTVRSRWQPANCQEHLGGDASTAIQVVVHFTDGPVTEGSGKQVLAKATAMLDKDPRIADIVQPQPGATLSQDGTTAVLLAGADADPSFLDRAS